MLSESQHNRIISDEHGFEKSSESSYALCEFMMHCNLQLYGDSRQWRCIIRTTSHQLENKRYVYQSLCNKMTAFECFNEFETRRSYGTFIPLKKGEVF